MPNLAAQRSVAEARPLLTLAIPSYNRSANLALLLRMIAPQLAELPQIELIVSDNASPDDTEQVMQVFLREGLRCRYIRNETNIGADPNFLQCYDQAKGKYVWIFGDDDVLFPGALAHIVGYLQRDEVDIVYLTPFGFFHSPNERNLANPKPDVYAYSTAADFIHAVGLRGDFALISSIIVNRDRIEVEPHPEFAGFSDTNLLQLGCTFTPLRNLRRGLVFERGLYAVCELNPSRPFDVARVFGVNWFKAAQRYLGDNPALVDIVLKDQLYSWFTTNWYGMRRRAAQHNLSDPVGQMRPLYGRFAIFWIATWPLLVLPMPLAGAWLAILRATRHLDRALSRIRHSPVPDART